MHSLTLLSGRLAKLMGVYTYEGYAWDYLSTKHGNLANILIHPNLPIRFKINELMNGHHMDIYFNRIAIRYYQRDYNTARCKVYQV